MTKDTLYMGELEPEEERLIDPMVQGLKSKINRHSAIGSKKMCSLMKQAGYDITQLKLRQVIHVIRVRGLVKCLIHSPEGYYITASMRDGRRHTTEMRRKVKLLDLEEKALTEQFNEYYAPRMFK